MTSNMLGLPTLPDGPGALSAHLSKYRDHVAHLDMTEAAKDELLKVVWRIMGNFVDRAWGDDPVQHVHELRARGEAKPDGVVGSERVHSQLYDESLASAFVSHAAGGPTKERS